MGIHNILSGKFLGFFTFIFFETLSTSKFWISLKLCPDSFIIFSIKVINGAVLSTVARSEVAFTWNLSVGAFKRRNELI